MKKYFFVISLLTRPLYATDFLLSEGLLKELANDIPTIKQIEVLSDSTRLSHFRMRDVFNPVIKANAYYAENKEKQLNNFVPITSPIKDFSFEIEKATPLGIKLGAKVFAQQTTNNFVTSSTTTGLSAKFAMDLHKDFLGKTTATELENTKLEVEKAELEQNISKKAFIQNLRKLYWALVANNEAQKITQELLVTANKQVKQAEARFKNKIADSGEVARYRSQVAARNASLISLKYQESSLHQTIKELIPNLGDKNIILSTYNLDETVTNVLDCSTMLEKKNPLQWSTHNMTRLFKS